MACTTVRDALAMVEHAERAGVRLAVNQNGRYDSSINAARQLVRQGVLGTRLVANIDMHVETVWQEYLQNPRRVPIGRRTAAGRTRRDS